MSVGIINTRLTTLSAASVGLHQQYKAIATPVSASPSEAHAKDFPAQQQ
jgi:hypothetical protein